MLSTTARSRNLKFKREFCIGDINLETFSIYVISLDEMKLVKTE